MPSLLLRDKRAFQAAVTGVLLAKIRSGAMVSSSAAWSQYISVPSPAILDREVASLNPSQLLQTVFERRHARLCLRVVGDKTHQHADFPETVSVSAQRRDLAARETVGANPTLCSGHQPA